MTPERMAELVARWVRFYARGLHAPIAERRIDEIDLDLQEHIAHERGRGTSDRRIALSILSRMVRGMAADASWRSQQPKAISDRSSSAEEAMKKHRSIYGSVARVALATGLILLLPLVAMQFTEDVAWTLRDFVAAGALLFGPGLTLELIARRGGTPAYRAAVGVAVATALLLVWLNLAVGIIGTEDHPANRMYIGVLAVGIIGAALARLQPQGMARALLITGLAQALVTAVAVVARLGFPASGPLELLGANGLFVALWLGSAWLFRHAAREQPPAAARAGG